MPRVHDHESVFLQIHPAARGLSGHHVGSGKIPDAAACCVSGPAPGRGRAAGACPVIDETGGFGLSLYQIADDQDIAAITAQDPIIKHGVGQYAHYPMLHLKTRE
ncbi:hypothetical protein [Xanthomonas arboricola]|uniref:hypothetical protein n=1 Tax=Xanthomonas arboricola TaxID=56448 RepID=UPI001E2C22A2|nr:hypothetical protein [Xanthomonas arboricola]